MACDSDARPLDMPIGLAIHRPVMDVVGWDSAVVEGVRPGLRSSVRAYAVCVRHNRAEVSRNLHSSMHPRSSRQPELTCIRSDFRVVHAEIHQMAPAIGHIASSGAKSLHPAAVAERPIYLGVDATLPDSCVGDAREIGFAGIRVRNPTFSV